LTRLRAAGLAAVAGIAALALAIAGVEEDPAPPKLRSGELSAERFVESIGVVTHLHYTDTAYGRQADVIARLRELGVGHVREAAPPLTGPLADGLRALRAAGMRATLGSGDPESDPAQWVSQSLQVMGGAVAAFEAPNELDNSGDPDWPAKLRRYMPELEAAVRDQAPGTPVIGPSFIDPASRGEIPGDLPGLFNGHPYSGGEPPEASLDLALDQRDASTPGRGAVFTETGYHNALSATIGQPPASEQAAAVYMPRLLLTAFGAGVRRTFIYELLDEKPEPRLADPEQHFGLLRNDFSPKPAFTAVKTLIAVMRSRAPSRPGRALAWTLAVDGDEAVEHITLVRRDGARVIALWRPVSVWDRDARRAVEPGQAEVELSFSGLGGHVEVWRPSVSTRPVLRGKAVRRLELELEGDVALVSVR
jgi:hypothetical protein